MMTKINHYKIEQCKKHRERVRKYSQKLYQDYKLGILTYDEYFFRLSKFLRGRSEKAWIDYYDDLIYKLSNNEKIIKIASPRNFDKPINILANLLVISLIGLLVLSASIINNPSITGFAIFDRFRQPLVETSNPSYQQNETLLLAIHPTSSGIYREAYILSNNNIIDIILLDCSSPICYDDVVASRSLSNYQPGKYDIAVYDYSRNDYVQISFTVTRQALISEQLSTHDFICHKCSPHKVPPITDVQVALSSSSNPGEFTTISDYYPSSWQLVNANGGYVVRINSTYNKISWDIISNDSLISITYTLNTPQRTSPPTDYYFISEINGVQDSPWQVKVADPTTGTQFARPDLDLTTGGWTNSDGGPTSLYVYIREVNPSDGTFVKSPSNPSNNTYNVSLSNVLDPFVSTGHILRYRFNKYGSRTTNLYVKLMQGNTKIAEYSHYNLNTTFTTATKTLTSQQADTITNYNDLRLHFMAVTSGGGPASQAQVSWAELEVPAVIIPTLNVSISAPNDLQLVTLRKPFNITSKVTCLQVNCNAVYATVRYNLSSSLPFTPINATNGETRLSLATPIISIWNRTYNPGSTDEANAVTIDSSNNIYVVGHENGVNWRIMKINSTGSSIWNRTYNPGSSDIAFGVTIDKSNNIYAVGQRSGVDWFIMKINSTGSSIWNRTYNPAGSDIANKVAIDPSGNNIYVVGVSSSDWFIMKINATGYSIWNRTYNPGAGDEAKAVAIDSSGNNIYVVGYRGDADNNWFIMKINSTGGSIWNRTYNPAGSNIAYGVTIDPSNNIYVVGQRGDATVNWFIMKINSTGGSIWNRTYNPAGSNIARGVTIDSSNNIYVVGQQALANWFIMKINSTGGSIWNRTYNPAGSDNARGVTIDSSNNIYVVGGRTDANLNWFIMKLHNNLAYQSCGILNQNQQCLFDWQINGTKTGAYEVGVYYNSSTANIINVTENRTVIVASTTTSTTTTTSIMPSLNVSISKPIDNENVGLRKSFNITSKVTCLQANCNDVFATARFNYSGLYPFRPINSSFSGETPLSVVVSRYTMSIWNRSYAPQQTARGVVKDSNNNIYVVGDTAGSSWQIMKVNTSGYSIWNRTYDITGLSDVAYGITIDSSSNIYVVGQENGADWRVMKLNANGNSIWNRTYNPATTDVARGVTIDSSNNIYVVGQRGDTDQNWFIMKINANGISIWNRTYNPGAADAAYGVTIDTSNNIYVVGYRTDADINWFIMKINANGISIWNRTYNPSATDAAYGVTIDSSNNIYAVGQRTDADNNWFIMKINSTGGSIWNRTYNPGAEDVARGAVLDSSNNLYVVGHESNANVRIIKLDYNGVSIWNRTYNPGATDIGFSITIDSNNNIYPVGVTDTKFLVMRLDNSLSYQSCGILNQNQQCLFDWQINGTKTGAYEVGVYYNSSTANIINVTENRTVIVASTTTSTTSTTTILPTLNISISKPIDNENVALRKSFNITSKVTCLQANCNDIFATARFNYSGLFPFRPINSSFSGETPLSTFLSRYTKFSGVKVYNPGSTDQAYTVDRDSFNILYIGGVENGVDWRIMKVTTNGVSIWNRTYNPGSTDAIFDLKTDANNNVYAVGWQTGSTTDWRIMKLDSNGVSIWNRTYNPGATDQATGVTVDSNNNVYVVGLQGDVNDNWRIIKLDANGVSIWNRTYNLGTTDRAFAVATDSNNNIYTVGFQDAVNWRIMKLNTNGVSIWNRTYNPGTTDQAYGITIDSTNNIYVTGAKDGLDWYIMKIDSNGVSIWNRTYNPGVLDVAIRSAIDARNNLYVVGYQDNSTIWRIMKLDANGVSIWNLTQDPGTKDEARDAVTTTNNNLIVVGFQNSVDWRIAGFVNRLNLQSCGNLSLGKSCIFDWQINATKIGSYEVGVYYNTTSLINVTENRTVIVGQVLPDLSLTSITILPSGIVEPTINSNTSMNVTVGISNQSVANSCIVKVYNTTHLVFAPSASILSNPIRCIASWNMDYWRNPGIWNVTVNVTTLAGSNKMIFNSFTYNSLKASLINPTIINFTGNPGQVVNSSNAYPLTIKNAGNLIFNITLKGTDYIGKPDASKRITVMNSTINKTSTGIFTPITYTFQQIYTKVYPGDIKDIFFRTSIPINLPSQEYEGNITIAI